MRNLLLLAAFYCFLIIPSVAQQRAHLLEWQKGSLLKWEDFQGKADQADVVHAAVTFAGIEVKIESVDFFSGSTTFIAKGVFDKHQSWAHPARRDPRILCHEQVHFDIAEVYARKLQQKLNSLRLKKQDKAKVKKLQQLYSQAQLAAQIQFDEETMHGLNTTKAQEWRQQIDRELKVTSPDLKIMHQTLASKK